MHKHAKNASFPALEKMDKAALWPTVHWITGLITSVGLFFVSAVMFSYGHTRFFKKKKSPKTSQTQNAKVSLKTPNFSRAWEHLLWSRFLFLVYHLVHEKLRDATVPHHARDLVDSGLFHPNQSSPIRGRQFESSSQPWQRGEHSKNLSLHTTVRTHDLGTCSCSKMVPFLNNCIFSLVKQILFILAEKNYQL